MNAIALVSSYLFPRYHKVACGDDVSPLAPLVAGVPQVSSISPLCFSLLITEVLEFSKYYMYADFLQIYHIAGRGKCFLNVFVRLTVFCLGFLNGILPIH
jgi:hypothetical protein